MALTRLSAGVYRDAKGKTVLSKTGKAPDKKKKGGMTDKPAKTATAPTGPVYEADPNMSSNQNAIGYGMESGDISATNAANEYAKQFDPGKYNYGGPGPASGQYEDFRKQAYDQQLADFDRRDSVARQKENDDLARWAQSTGNAVDSPAYAAKQQQLSQSQNDRLANAQANATNFAGQEADRNIQGQNTIFDVNRGQYENVRNDPLNQFGAYRSAVSGSWGQGQQQSDNLQTIGAQGQEQRKTQKAPQWVPPRAGGGGGSGGGSGGMTAAPVGYQPQYMGGQQGAQQPGYGTQLANSLLPKLAAPLAEKAGGYLAGQLSSLWD